MRLLLAIVRDADAQSMLPELLAHKFRVTRIASTGGWLRQGNTTFLIGVEDSQVEEALGVIGKSSTPPPAPEAGRTTVFVLGNVRYQQL
jgi:uncharacterized protein YaaQ